MASPSVAQSPPAHDTFYVVKQCSLTSTAETVTVVHQVPTGAEELASFDYPNQAIDFAEATVRNYGASAHWLNLSTHPMVWLAPG